jgi:putative hydrolase of the HAD superfamily
LKRKTSGKQRPAAAHTPGIQTLLLDIGNVILSNGWDRYSRKKASDRFRLDPQEFDDRHKIFFDRFETGKISLDDYLHYVIFYEERDFGKEEFLNFMFAQSKPIKDSMAYFLSIKNKYKLRVFSLNNEGRELNEYRIKTFDLGKLFDGFISSCYVHLRKPDKDIYLIASEISFTAPESCLFIDDRAIHVRVAKEIGFNAIQFTSLAQAKKQMARFGLSI